MTVRISADFAVTGWDERPFDERVGTSTLTEALVSREYTNGIEATSTTKWLMAYAPDKSATYVGLERLVGTVAGRHGTLVLLHDGAFEDGVASATLRVVSGTDQFKNVTGTGEFRADPSGSITLTLDGV